ncbi:hypothetical protein KIP88_29560 [Bradyrhizobium sp. SRL28]|uniref:hypothetical protein n=1 Tax=Bradyrhizobium sp. SRL28 TaxID=2836178 RepID=UPI001BDDED5B|nr:hypothetical protein [Bradyrhizobium sp. SRL28]MBT1514642.1 hypothetical protein [Bradyrhizobium sp. SRL28]
MCAILFLGGFGMFEVSGTVRLRSSNFGETAFALRAEHMRHHRREGYESFHHMSSQHTNVGIIWGMQA